MAKKIAALIAITTFLTAPAHADWQFTTWGMTSAQVLAASHGQAVVLEGEDSSKNSIPGDTAKVSMPYDSGQLHFKALFYFDAHDHLDRVRLHTDTASAGALRQALREKYGDTIAGEKPYDDVLDWMTPADHIRFYSIVFATVEYLPRVSQDTKGL